MKTERNSIRWWLLFEDPQVNIWRRIQIIPNTFIARWELNMEECVRRLRNYEIISEQKEIFRKYNGCGHTHGLPLQNTQNIQICMNWLNLFAIKADITYLPEISYIEKQTKSKTETISKYLSKYLLLIFAFWVNGI